MNTIEGRTKAINGDDLLEALRKRAYVLTECAEVSVRNSAPLDWDIVVLAGGVKFFYRDGSEFIDGPREISMPVGAAAMFTSRRARGCVYQYLTALHVRVGEEPPVIMTLQDGVTAGQCLLRGAVELRLRSSIPESVMTSGRLADRLGLATVGERQ